MIDKVLYEMTWSAIVPSRRANKAEESPLFNFSATEPFTSEWTTLCNSKLVL